MEILVERRRLGRTHLDVKPGQIGVANATKKENLGVFDYAHLRVPLPTDLKGTGIFSVQTTGKYPDAYFLMVSLQSCLATQDFRAHERSHAASK